MRVVYVDSHRRLGTLDEPRLEGTTERHAVALPPPPVAAGDPFAALTGEPGLGLVLEMDSGYPSAGTLRLARRGLRAGCRVWLFWPEEGAVEVMTLERLSSYRRHRVVVHAYRILWEPLRRLFAVPRRLSYVLRDVPSRDLPRWFVQRIARLIARPAGGGTAESATARTVRGAGEPAMVRHAQRLAGLREARHAARAVTFPPPAGVPDPQSRIRGCGVYLRTDFWAPIMSGGSYGHTCYVAKELAAVTESFVCFMANRFPLLDAYGLTQVVMPRPSPTNNEDDMVKATPHYLDLLRPAFEDLRPAYIYERLCIGNSVGATLSAEFGVPYLLEYNGSEISMRRTFEGTGYVYEAEYLEAEALAFEQATLISVVSAEIRHSLVARGVSPAKILVNPNGVDLEAYGPADPDERNAIREQLGFVLSDRVIGFTGTFGGWHGIDVLSEAIPQICRRCPEARFLLIGDGNFKPQIDQTVASLRLEHRVVSTGRVPQVEGARLLKACDIYVSPHSTHMIDSKFFGSPTKIFEYMALGGGVVASDLEQIGQVLSPSLTPEEAMKGAPVSDERAVLCAPGDVGEFVQGVVALVEQPALAAALGRNARRAAGDHYSWTRHVANLWRFLAGETNASEMAPDLRRKPRQLTASIGGTVAVLTSAADVTRHSADVDRVVSTGDVYKDQVQRQWNNDPAGSHYVTEAPTHTLEWYLEAERHRYGSYAPWMPGTMEFDGHGGEDVLEIGGGMGTDLAQFAKHRARVTDVDLSAGHLTLAKENFMLRGLQGRFMQLDAESLEFENNAFDLVYSNGVLHHTPNTQRVVNEILRVLKPGGRVIVMMYAEDSLYYWRNLMWNIGLREGQLNKYSMSEIMSRTVERSDNAAAHPLVKTYTRARLRQLFEGFADIEIVQRQMAVSEVPRSFTWVPRRGLATLLGWNLIIKARKPGV